MSTSETLSHDEAISQFCGVTGADEDRAKGLLEACEWNLELAINMHVDTDPEGRSNKKAQDQSTSSAGASGASSDGAGTSSWVPNRNQIHVDADADDEDSLTIEGQSSDTRGGRFASRYNRSSNIAIRRFGAGASGTESSGAADAAYGNFSDSDGVRPPIAPVRQILNPNPIGYPAPELPQMARRYNTRTGPNATNVFDAFRDFQAEAQWQEMLQEGEADVNSSEGRRTLQELFRPPLELMFRGNFTRARESGTSQNRWLLVNIQNGREFACQVLNRDVWSHQTVRDIIKEHFVFWQTYHDSYEGQRYVQFYHVTKLPHVAIIDPRTGEQMRSWPTSIDHNSFCDSVIEFLTDHPSPDGSTPDANTMKKLRVKEDDEDEIGQDSEPQIIPARATLYDQSEEAQLEAAIKASLQEPAKVEINDDTIEIDDDTIEASDVSDLEPSAARDTDPVEMLPVSDNNSKPSRNNSQFNKQHENNRTTGSQSKLAANNNKNTSNTTDDDNITSAEALKLAAANQPIEVEGPECRIALRFPDGSSHIQKFSASEQLETVKKFVQMGKSIFRTAEIEFVAPPNRKLTETTMNSTLEQLGLCPASRLEVKFVED